MARELSIVLRIKNQLAVGLAKAKASLENFGSSVLNIGKVFAGAFIAAGTAVAGFAAKALSAYAESERATTALKAALGAYGEEVEINTERIKQLAGAIQDETGISDDALVARAAKLRMLGVETEQLGAAMRATVALTNAGMDEEAANRAIAQAMSGNFSALQKYIPALRTAQTEEEKIALLHDFLARGYEAQKAQLDTLGGQWGLLKERIGDAWEEIGGALASNDTIKAAIESVSLKVKEFGQAIRDWVNAGGVEEAKAVILYAFENIKYALLDATANLKVFWAAMTDNKAVQWLGSVLSAQGQLIMAHFRNWGAWAEALWEKITHPTQPFQAPDTSAVKAAEQELGKAVMGRYVKESEKMKEALAEKEALRQQHDAKMTKLDADYMAAIEQQRKKRAEQEKVEEAARVQTVADADLKIKTGAITLTEELQEQGGQRVENEAKTAAAIVKENETAAAAVTETWAAAAEEQKKAATIDTGMSVPGRAGRILRKGSSRPGPGSVSEGSWNAFGSKLTSGRWVNTPWNMRTGSVFRYLTDDAALRGARSLSSRGVDLKNMDANESGWLILRELQRMNANQERLLTFS